MLQTATSGSYEHRALTYALFEVRRALHGALEEWELLDREVSLGEVLGEGGSAMVYYGRFLDGPAAVKVFKRPSLSESSASSVPSLDSSDMLVTLSSQVSDTLVLSDCNSDFDVVGYGQLCSQARAADVVQAVSPSRHAFRWLLFDFTLSDDRYSHCPGGFCESVSECTS